MFLKPFLSYHLQWHWKNFVYHKAHVGIILLGTKNSSGFFLKIYDSISVMERSSSWACTDDKICIDYSSDVDHKVDKSHRNAASVSPSMNILDTHKGLRGAQQVSPEANHCQSSDVLYAQKNKLPLSATRSAQFCICREIVLQVHQYSEQCWSLQPLHCVISPGKEVASLQLQKLPRNPGDIPELQPTLIAWALPGELGLPWLLPEGSKPKQLSENIMEWFAILCGLTKYYSMPKQFKYVDFQSTQQIVPVWYQIWRYESMPFITLRSKNLEFLSVAGWIWPKWLLQCHYDFTTKRPLYQEPCL